MREQKSYYNWSTFKIGESRDFELGQRESESWNIIRSAAWQFAKRRGWKFETKVSKYEENQDNRMLMVRRVE